MQLIRQEDLSIYRYLRDIVLSDYIEFQEKEELTLSKDRLTTPHKVYDIQTSVVPSPFERGRGIVYFDDLTSDYINLIDRTTTSGTPEQSSRVVVYDKYLNTIEDSSYMIDYLSGKIIMLEGIQPKYIDYYSYYVSLIDSWDSLPTSSPPVVVIDINSTKKKGYQLGGGKEINRSCNLFIFSSSSSERSDLTEILHDGLYQKTCPIYNFDRGSALDYDGTFFNRKRNMDKATNLFNRTVVSGTSNIRFEDVESKNINLPLTLTRRSESATLSDLTAKRSKISFTLAYYN
jgi:hypothetical protein